MLIWGGTIAGSRTPLHVFDNSTATADVYRDAILDPFVKLFWGVFDPDFLLMGDNAHPHRTCLVQEYLESEDITYMFLPARSPELNLIEHAWDALGRRVASHIPSPWIAA